jgi:oxygen-dependent protoporphyrinogen oxidase
LKRIAIVGGGIAGLAAAYEIARLARAGFAVEAVLFESSNRLGGVIETVREGGFTVECGPDAWVSAKPWARELAVELGLEAELIASNDATRKTHIFLTGADNPSGRLVPMPDGFNMMVPSNLDALEGSPLFTSAAIAAYRAEPERAAELLASIPAHDESVADFTLRHFGSEVLTRVAAPLLSGVFGGDVHRLSVRATMPAFIQMEREHGSLVAALQRKANNGQRSTSLFTTLRTGLGTLIDRLLAAIPPHWIRLNTTVTALQPSSDLTPLSSQIEHETTRSNPAWRVHVTSTGRVPASESFDAVFLAVPLDASRRLLSPLDPDAAQLLPSESSSAVLVAFAFDDAIRVPLPPGFGFLVPPEAANASSTPELRPSPFGDSEQRSKYLYFASDPAAEAPAAEAAVPTPASLLLACTFVDQKFPHRVPPNGRLIRAFFGGAAAARIARCNNDEIAAIARLELARILNTSTPITAAPMPAPVPALTVVRRWPNSLPQYPIGHVDRIAKLHSRLSALPGLTLLGNALNGLGIPDLIRDARQAVRTSAGVEPTSEN